MLPACPGPGAAVAGSGLLAVLPFTGTLYSQQGRWKTHDPLCWQSAPVKIAFQANTKFTHIISVK